MKIYVLVTTKTDDSGDFSISWHKRIYFLQEEAFKEARLMGIDTAVVELTPSNSWNHEQRLEKND
jgi:hypothetical protein